MRSGACSASGVLCPTEPAAAEAKVMRCSYCHRPLRLLDRRHPQRLLLPRCRVCRRYEFGTAHKIVLFLLGALIISFLIGILSSK
jgi:hypothetical protein